MKLNRRIWIAIMSLTLTGSVFAAETKPEDLIHIRKAGFDFMAWNMGKIKAMVIDNPQAYNKDQVAAAANAIAAIANSGMGALFVPGTDKDIGTEKTRLKPEFFQKPDEARTVAMNWSKESTELAKVAATGDVAAIKAQFGKTGATCKACHDKFRKD